MQDQVEKFSPALVLLPQSVRWRSSAGPAPCDIGSCSSSYGNVGVLHILRDAGLVSESRPAQGFTGYSHQNPSLYHEKTL